MAAQIWFEGQKKVKNFASTKNMLLALNGKYKSKTPSVLFVHDRFQGWKLFATNAFYVDEDGMISSFLLKSDADKFAESVNSEVLDFETLSKKYI
jgi:NitT/TauT family transport system substrate-binding protein